MLTGQINPKLKSKWVNKRVFCLKIYTIFSINFQKAIHKIRIKTEHDFLQSSSDSTKSMMFCWNLCNCFFAWITTKTSRSLYNLQLFCWNSRRKQLHLRQQSSSVHKSKSKPKLKVNLCWRTLMRTSAMTQMPSGGCATAGDGSWSSTRGIF